MTGTTYDTRSRQDILAAPHFARYRELPGFNAVGLRELRTLDAFFVFAQARHLRAFTFEDFLAFVEDDESPRKLENLRTAFRHLEPASSPIHEILRSAIRTKRPRTRVCDRRSREAILAQPYMAPYSELPQMGDVELEDLRVLDRFLAYAQAREIMVPTVGDFLGFVDDRASSRRLRSLKTALDILLPGNPAVLLTLNEAIRKKSPRKPSRAGSKARPTAVKRIPVEALPAAWRRVLTQMRSGMGSDLRAAPAASVVDNLEEVLREYAKVVLDRGLPLDVTIEGVRALEETRTAYAGRKKKSRYSHEGDRPATRHTAVMRLRLFGEWLGVDPLVLAALRQHENALRRGLNSVNKLKEGRLEQLPSLSDTWCLAEDLLARARTASRRQTGQRLMNEAASIALWMFLPLRLKDGQLVWGRDIYMIGDRYAVDIDTHKEGEPLRGRLHPDLTPFLDALILQGVDPIHLGVMRARACEGQLPVFRTVDGRILSAGYPSSVWRRHFGTGAHITRTRIHSEFALLGPEAVEAGIALTAHKDPRSKEEYRTSAASVRAQERGQDMIEALLDECLL